MGNIEKYNYCRRCDKKFPIDIDHCSKCGDQLVNVVMDFDPNAKCYFLKISSDAVIQSLRRGNIWFRPPMYYQNYCEDGEQVIADNEDSKFCMVNETNKEYDAKSLEKAIFCVYRLNTNSEGNYKIKEEDQEKLKKFGDRVSIISIPNFFRFFNKNARKMATLYKGDVVLYYSENLRGFISAFYKRECYEYQNEYRIVLQDEKFKNFYTQDGKLKSNNERYVYTHEKQLKNIFSRPIDIKDILHFNNVSEWEDKIKF